MATDIKGDNTMNEELQRAIEVAQQLPHDLQSVIAERILEEIEEMEWDAIVSKPHVQKRLSDLGDKAWENHLAGKTKKGGFGRD
jgi:chaperonin cofactor prefoldin